jgi:hypothetical protein
MPEQNPLHGGRTGVDPAAAPSDLVGKLDGLLRRALIVLGEAGEADCACRLAAEAWSVLRHDLPREAERYTGLLHRLTATRHPHRRKSS